MISNLPRGGGGRGRGRGDDDDDDDNIRRRSRSKSNNHDESSSSSSGDNMFLIKIRNVIRNIVNRNKSSGLISSSIRGLIRGLESVTGWKLLDNNNVGGGDGLVDDDRLKKRRGMSGGSSNGNVGRRKKKKKTTTTTPPVAVVETKKKTKIPHLTKQLSSTNPNYRIQRELKEFMTSPPPNLKVSVGSKNIRVWIVTLTGGKNTIFEGERYRLRIAFPKDYPVSPPSVYFLQPTPRHEHVYTNGDICLSLLGKDWRPTMTAQSIAVSILSILSGAREKSLPMDNAAHSQNKPGGKQDDWIYHDDNC